MTSFTEKDKDVFGFSLQHFITDVPILRGTAVLLSGERERERGRCIVAGRSKIRPLSGVNARAHEPDIKRDEWHRGSSPVSYPKKKALIWTGLFKYAPGTSCIDLLQGILCLSYSCRNCGSNSGPESILISSNLRSSRI